MPQLLAARIPCPVGENPQHHHPVVFDAGTSADYEAAAEALFARYEHQAGRCFWREDYHRGSSRAGFQSGRKSRKFGVEVLLSVRSFAPDATGTRVSSPGIPMGRRGTQFL